MSSKTVKANAARSRSHGHKGARSRHGRSKLTVSAKGDIRGSSWAVLIGMAINRDAVKHLTRVLWVLLLSITVLATGGSHLERVATVMELEAAILADKSGDREQLARIYTSVGRLYRIHGQPQAAVRYQLKSLELAERSSASPRVRVQSLNAVGVAYDALGDRVEARKYYERALSTAESVGSDAIVDFIRAELGGLLVALGDAEPARKFLEGVLERGLDQHPSLRYGQLSSAYYKLGRFDDAREAGQHGPARTPAREALASPFESTATRNGRLVPMVSLRSRRVTSMRRSTNAS